MMAQSDDLLSAPLPSGGGVALCCVRFFVWGVRFDTLCMNAFSPYMTWQCSCPYFQKKSLLSE
jgi:hypothetical protein